MTQPQSLPQKPIAEIVRPEITRLPELYFSRRLARRLITGLARMVVWLFTRTEVEGINNFPTQGPLLIVTNHLGDADLVLGVAKIPCSAEAFVKAELREYPVLGLLFRAYGVIWIHRGQPDRRALRVAMQGLNEGRIIGIAPEGRESLTGGLESGTRGAAYLAVKTEVPLLPITFTGTENHHIYANMKRRHRTPVTITIGQTFKVEPQQDWRIAVEKGTQTIMHTLARQLPPEYRGAYRTKEDY